MKIRGISDLHGYLPKYIPPCDVLCIAGDIIPLNKQKDYAASNKWFTTKFKTWIESLPCKKVFATPGNHDFYIEHLYKENELEDFCDYLALITNGKLHLLIDKEYEYDGIKFYGTPWIQPISFQVGKWAFESNDLKNQYKQIPKCDILITHDSPIENEQLALNTYAICKYHLYGHWHDGKSIPEQNRFNCSILDDFYSVKQMVNLPTINILTMKTKYELLQDFTKKVKNLAKPYLETLEGISDYGNIKKFNEELDNLLISFLDNPQDTEDEIEWNESLLTNDPDTEFIDDNFDFDDGK